MLFDLRTVMVKERVAFVKLTDTYDLLDPSSGQVVAIAKEEPSAWAKYLRLLVSKKLMPTTVNVYEHEGAAPALTIRRGVSILRPKVDVSLRGRNIGYFQAKAFSIGGAFRVFDTSGAEVAEVKGDWKGWNFQIATTSGERLGTVTKKWAGIGKEFFTSADNYVIDLTAPSSRAGAAELTPLLLAAGLAIDVVFKERK